MFQKIWIWCEIFFEVALAILEAITLTILWYLKYLSMGYIIIAFVVLLFAIESYQHDENGYQKAIIESIIWPYSFYMNTKIEKK